MSITSQMLYGQYQEFIYDDTVRTYAVYEPDLDPDPKGYPLIIGLHGGGSEGYEFMATAFLVQKANREDFILVYPNSLCFPITARWNAGDGYESMTDSTDDTGFISALIDTMIENYNVDTTRIYVMDFSNGSMITYRVAAELSHRIASMGGVSGQMAYEYCDPEFPVPSIHFHGLEDPLCFCEGGPNANGQAYLPTVDSVMAVWRGINSCS